MRKIHFFRHNPCRRSGMFACEKWFYTTYYIILFAVFSASMQYKTHGVNAIREIPYFNYQNIRVWYKYICYACWSVTKSIDPVPRNLNNWCRYIIIRPSILYLTYMYSFEISLSGLEFIMYSNAAVNIDNSRQTWWKLKCFFTRAHIHTHTHGLYEISTYNCLSKRGN